MLFHSLEFLFAFLPASVAVFFLLQRHISDQAALTWMIVASLFFYGWWNPAYVPLLLGSMTFNYAIGKALHGARTRRTAIVTAGIACNLVLLGWYKYANFFVDSANAVAGADWTLGTIILPLGISFFTFEQISWLIEAYQKKTTDWKFLDYCVFLTNFPKLIAGPVIRAHEMLPQIADKDGRRICIEHISVGLTIFLIGLGKKVILADAMVPLVEPVFHASALGAHVTFWEAWAAALAYTLQIYFDFSGYTDMAIGAARMFGFVLPLNFCSPYKATDIGVFWARWHMSLSRFLREYVYFPLGGGRVTTWKRYRNLLLTMLLSGLWHGAGWTFVAWGGLHGIYLIVHQAWRDRRAGKRRTWWWPRAAGWALTFVAVMISWVLFRAESIASALRLLWSMSGLQGVSVDTKTLVLPPGTWIDALPWIAALLLTALLLPNTQQIMRRFRPALDATDEPPGGLLQALTWKPTALWALALACLALASVSCVILQRQTEFLYFQF